MYVPVRLLGIFRCHPGFVVAVNISSLENENLLFAFNGTSAERFFDDGTVDYRAGNGSVEGGDRAARLAK